MMTHATPALERKHAKAVADCRRAWLTVSKWPSGPERTKEADRLLDEALLLGICDLGMRGDVEEHRFPLGWQEP